MAGRRIRDAWRAQQRRVNQVLRFFGNGVDVHTVRATDPGPCGAFEWRVRFELARPSPTGGLIVQQVDSSTVLGGCDRSRRDRRRRPPYWVAWEVPRGARGTGLDHDDAWAQAGRPRTKGRVDLLGTVRFFEGAHLPPEMVPHNPDTPAGTLPSTTSRPPFFTAIGATHHDLHEAWDCCSDPPSRADLRTVPAAAATGAPARTVAGEGVVATVPPWTDGRYDARKTRALRDAAAAAGTMSDFQLRAAIRAFCDDAGPSIRELSRPYLLLRAVFDLPPWIARTDAQVFGGWNHPSTARPGQASFRIGWPVAAAGGALEVPGEYHAYRGRPYDAPAEFDYFAARFPRRG